MQEREHKVLIELLEVISQALAISFLGFEIYSR